MKKCFNNTEMDIYNCYTSVVKWIFNVIIGNGNLGIYMYQAICTRLYAYNADYADYSVFQTFRQSCFSRFI